MSFLGRGRRMWGAALVTAISIFAIVAALDSPPIKCTKTPSSIDVSEGDVVTYEYKVYNPSDTVISDISLIDSDLGKIKLDRTALGPNESTIGVSTYTVTEDDILTGPREIITTFTGIDNLNERVESHCSSWLVPVAEYYEGNSTGGGAISWSRIIVAD